MPKPAWRRARRDLDDTGRQQLWPCSLPYDLLLARDRRTVAVEAAELYGRSLEAGKLRHRAGDASLVEMSRLQIEKSRADKRGARQSQADLEGAQAALAYLVGR